MGPAVPQCVGLRSATAGSGTASSDLLLRVSTLFFLLSGSSASGKKTIARELPRRLPNLEGYHDNRFAEEWGGDRLANLDRWVEMALRLEEDGIDLVIGGQSPLGELLAAPRAIELEGIAACVLDCHDFVRWDRIVELGIDPRWPIGIDTFCWATYHRMHASDPQWEKRICTDRDHPASVWSRWTEWTSEDPRWDVKMFDTTDLDLESATRAVAAWIESVRTARAPLMRDDKWWE